jgi:uncharacterized membrane protein YuzA (DUF378 family)
MVFDSFIKLVFLPGLLIPVFFLPTKSCCSTFFTVKHIFSKIKTYPERKTEPEGEQNDMKKLDVMAAALVIIGALNWGLAGAFHLDLVAAVFGMRFGETSALSSAVYVLVGLSGLYQALTWKSIQRRWYSSAVEARA